MTGVRPILMLVLCSLPGAAAATDYTVDFTRVPDLEGLRPLVQSCKDFDALELYRAKMESAPNLERLRPTLSAMGLVLFNKCPAGLARPGVIEVGASPASSTPGYSVDFTRVKDFETLRPLIEGCTDFGGLEHFRPRLEAAANLNDLAASLKGIGFGMFDGCPPGIAGAGITAVQ